MTVITMQQSNRSTPETISATARPSFSEYFVGERGGRGVTGDGASGGTNKGCGGDGLSYTSAGETVCGTGGTGTGGGDATTFGGIDGRLYMSQSVKVPQVQTPATHAPGGQLSSHGSDDTTRPDWQRAIGGHST